LGLITSDFFCQMIRLPTPKILDFSNYLLVMALK
jgi:hypothetical protein